MSLVGRQWDGSAEVEFAWPCSRRVAHKPHVVDEGLRDGGCDRSYRCVGVGAHPATMIGRAS